MKITPTMTMTSPLFNAQMIYEPLLPFFPRNKSITPNAAWWGIASHGLLGF